MFFREKLRNADKEATRGCEYITDSQGYAVINIKATDAEQIFSSYNYDSYGKLNEDLNKFIIDKANFVPMNKDIKIKLYTNESTKKEEVKKAIEDNYKKEYVSLKNEMKKNAIFSLVMFVLGIASLSALLLMHTYFYNIYFETVLEIVTWVFMWEAVDSYFLKRNSLKRQGAILLKLFKADIEVVKLKKLAQKKKEQ